MAKSNLSVNAGSLTPEFRKVLGVLTEEEEIAARRREHEREYGLTRPFLQCNSISRPKETLRWAFQLIREYDDQKAASLFWPLVTEEWSGFDRIDHATYGMLFRRFKRWWPPEIVRGLPSKTFTIYRGQSDLSRVGLSWTTQKQVAEQFAAGHRGMIPPKPVIFEKVILPDQVAFSADDRDEAEVVLFKAPHRKTVFRQVFKPPSR